MRKGVFDDDYFFYDDGRILHSYDKTQTKFNLEEFVSADSIPIEKRMQLLQNCPSEKYERIKAILNL